MADIFSELLFALVSLLLFCVSSVELSRFVLAHTSFSMLRTSSLVVQFSMTDPLPLFAKAYILYHALPPLSRGFCDFFKIFRFLLTFY